MITDSAMRRKAYRRGYRLTLLRENSRWFNAYGPWIASDCRTNVVIARCMTSEEINEWLNSEPTRSGH